LFLPLISHTQITPDQSPFLTPNTGFLIGCSPWDLQILTFRIANAGKAPKLNWHVVVGRDIEYYANPNNRISIWDWKLGVGNCDNFFDQYWKLINVMSNQGNKGSMQYAPFNVPSNILPKDNNDFGDANGLLRLRTAFGTDCKKVKVFYNQDTYNNVNPNEPNWFFYWTQFVPKNSIIELSFNKDLYALGSTESAIAKTEIGPNANLNRLKGNMSSGLHSFYEIMIHENEHIVIYRERWPLPKGYDTSRDKDFDFVPDEDEIADAKLPKPYGFVVGINDQYDTKYPMRADTRYQEERCDRVSYALKANGFLNDFDFLDWSFDATNLHQGKQWIK
jgi:hypothetical protein